MADDAPASTISVCIVCRNEASKLGACLESVQWADQVVVMDLSSDDGSADVAAQHGASVVHRAPHPIVEPLRNELAQHATGTWILALDPDERITPGLARELRTQAARRDIDAVVIPRMNFDFGWAPASPLQRYEPQLRMYRPAAVTWPEFPNALPPVPEARLARLPARDDLVMEHHRNVSVAETADRLVRYAPAEAAAMLERGQTFTAAAMFKDLRKQLFRHVVDARAWDEGVPGIMRAIVLINHKVYVWVALWQQSGSPRTPEDDASVAKLGRVLGLLGPARRLRAKLRRRR